MTIAGIVQEIDWPTVAASFTALAVALTGYLAAKTAAQHRSDSGEPPPSPSPLDGLGWRPPETDEEDDDLLDEPWPPRPPPTSSS